MALRHPGRGHAPPEPGRNAARLERHPPRYAANHDRNPATSDAESLARNTPGASLRHSGHGPVAVVLEPATLPVVRKRPHGASLDEAAVTRFGTGGLIRSDVARARPMSERSVRWMPARPANCPCVRPNASCRPLTANLNRSRMSALARLTIAARLGFRSHTAMSRREPKGHRGNGEFPQRVYSHRPRRGLW
jgi:hypothetical protein